MGVGEAGLLPRLAWQRPVLKPAVRFWSPSVLGWESVEMIEDESDGVSRGQLISPGRRWSRSSRSSSAVNWVGAGYPLH